MKNVEEPGMQYWQVNDEILQGAFFIVIMGEQIWISQNKQHFFLWL